MVSVFTYAHVKWLYGQSERAYYLNYFIIRFRFYSHVCSLSHFLAIWLHPAGNGGDTQGYRGNNSHDYRWFPVVSVKNYGYESEAWDEEWNKGKDEQETENENPTNKQKKNNKKNKGKVKRITGTNQNTGFLCKWGLIFLSSPSQNSQLILNRTAHP